MTAFWLVSVILSVTIFSDVVFSKAGDHHHPDDIQCFDHLCKHDEICRVFNSNGMVSGQCIKNHHINHAMGCPQTLADGQQCFCNTAVCSQQVILGTQQKAGHVHHGDHVQCDGHVCHPDEVCRHDMHPDGLHSHCGKHDPHLVQCTSLPVEHQPCFCNTNACNTQLYQMIFQNNHVQQNSGPLQCGGHICHDVHEKCIIEESWDKHLHLRCAKDLHHVKHCLPNLLTRDTECFCDTKSCVDQTLISLFNGHEVSGLICADHDDHVCHPAEVCTIVHEKNGHFKKHCAHQGQSTECTALPQIGQQCYCTTQECVYGQYAAPVTTAAPTTPVPTTAAPTTAVPNTNAPTNNMTDAPTSGAPTNMTAVPVGSTVGPTSAPQTNATMAPQTNVTVAVSNVTVAQNATVTPQPTVQPTTSSSTMSALPCVDDEDQNFSCVIYDMQFNMCAATAPTLVSIANKRCRKYCGICGLTTGGTVPPNSGPTTAVPCVDHDARCSQFAAQICGATVSQDYVIATCAKTCNKCTEYLALLQAQQPKCLVCGDPSLTIPCSLKDIYNSGSSAVACPTGYDYCMTDLHVDANNNKDVFKRCAKRDECETKWLKESADLDYCSKYGQVMNPNAHQCHFCCQGDGCNTNIKPDDLTLVPKTPIV